MRSRKGGRWERAYRAQLKRCGFRSWAAANRRRDDLIHTKVYHKPWFTPDKLREFKSLQKLSSFFVRWQNDNSEAKQLFFVQRMHRDLITNKEAG